MTIAQKIIPQTWIADSAEPSPSGTFFAVFLDLPAPPQKFVDLFRSIGIPNSDSEDQGAYTERNDGTRYYTHRALTNWKGQSFVAPRVQRGSLNADWEDWVRDNITDQYKDTGIGWTLGSPECPSIGAHADRTRQATLLYNIDPGGPDTELVFYQENGYPLIRTRGDHTLSDENLKSVLAVRSPVNCWYYINTRVLHSVENMISPRLNFQISLDCLPDNLRQMII
jgi:hypothetical protein